MKVKQVICAAGRSGYMHRDLMAIKAGARQDGMIFHGPTVTPGFKKIVEPATIISVMLLLEDGHCLKDHVLAACNRPELRAEAAMLGTSLHTLVQMVDNGLGVTLLPKMALDAGILQNTDVVAKPLDADHPERRIALAWRRGSPREKEFNLLADALRQAE